ncbi:MAG: spheroidene monooxygenase [Actinobacteria bacterium]|nr:spheroidene monooxygenase [Actinomycetota bacterium]
MITVLYLWKIPSSSVAFAFIRVAIDRFLIRKISSVTFTKSLGCGKGEKFSPSDADIHRWGLLVCLSESDLDDLDNSALVLGWRKRATREFRVLLKPISSHGRWSGKSPFDFASEPNAKTNEIASITRARISFFQAIRFWRSIPPVAQSLHESPGLIHAIGIGEAPIGLQGTFSLWTSADDLRNFAFKGEAHQKAISDTKRFQWYSEELFARFSVFEKRGSF